MKYRNISCKMAFFKCHNISVPLTEVNQPIVLIPVNGYFIISHFVRTIFRNSEVLPRLASCACWKHNKSIKRQAKEPLPIIAVNQVRVLIIGPGPEMPKIHAINYTFV